MLVPRAVNGVATDNTSASAATSGAQAETGVVNLETGVVIEVVNEIEAQAISKVIRAVLNSNCTVPAPHNAVINWNY
jgi:hypothetical protein